MKTLMHHIAFRLSWVLSLPLVLLVACDSFYPPSPPPPEIVSVDMNGVDYWSTFGEEIECAGAVQFRVEREETLEGHFVQVRSENILGTFNGLESGDSYRVSWDGPRESYRYLAGPEGSLETIQETILLTNGNIDKNAEGLVVTVATITPDGQVAFKVEGVIELP